MKNIYYPSCNFTIASPLAAKRIREYLSQKMEVAGCCKAEHEKRDPEMNAIYFCQACRETLEAEFDDIHDENLFVYLVNDPEFVWPDYTGLCVNVVDCYRDRNHPEIHEAVREALKRMHVQVKEIPLNREKSIFCGTLHYEPQSEELKQLLLTQGNIPISKMDKEIQIQLMKEAVSQYECDITVAYCNRCIKGIALGGGKAVHLLELATGTFHI